MKLKKIRITKNSHPARTPKITIYIQYTKFFWKLFRLYYSNSTNIKIILENTPMKQIKKTCPKCGCINAIEKMNPVSTICVLCCSQCHHSHRTYYRQPPIIESLQNYRLLYYDNNGNLTSRPTSRIAGYTTEMHL